MLTVTIVMRWNAYMFPWCWSQPGSGVMCEKRDNIHHLYMDIPLHCPCCPKYNRLQNRKLTSMFINRLKNQQSNFIDLTFFKHMHKFRSQCLKVFKQARSRILNIGHNGKYFQMILRAIIGNEIVFVLNHYSDTMCVVFLSGCEPVDILVGWLYRYCFWRSNYKSWVGMQFTGLSPPYFHTCSKPGLEFQRHMSWSVCCVFHLVIVPLNTMFVGILFLLKHGFYKKLLSFCVTCQYIQYSTKPMRH